MKAVDAIGNEIKVGDTIAWGAGGKWGFGIRLGIVTELVPRQVHVGWIEQPVYERNAEGLKVKVYDGIKEYETYVTVKMRMHPRSTRGTAKPREDKEVLVVQLPGGEVPSATDGF